MRARYILPRDRYTPCTRMEGVYLPTYSTIRQTRCYKSWPGVARVVLTRNARWKEMALASSGREREKGKGAKDSSGGESRNFAHEIITLCSFLGGGKGGGL